MRFVKNGNNGETTGEVGGTMFLADDENSRIASRQNRNPFENASQMSPGFETTHLRLSS